MKYLMLLLIPVVALSFACAKTYTVGTPVDKAKLDQIVPGTTKEGQIVEMFGQPAKKETTAAGETMYVYSYYTNTPKFWTKDIVHKTILEVYARNGVVQKYDIKREGVDSVSQ